MRRREFISLLGGATVTRPLTAHTQQGERVQRIGVLTPLAARSTKSAITLPAAD